MHRRAAWVLLWLLVDLPTTQALLAWMMDIINGGRCGGSERCFLFGMAYVMRAADPDCAESCQFFPSLQLGLDCGPCPDRVDIPETVNPTSRPTNHPTPAPTQMPTVSPTDTPTTTPTDTPSVAPTRKPTVATDFDIQLDLVDIPASDEATIQQAAFRWTQVITGDLAARTPYAIHTPPVEPPAGCSYPTVIDDLFACIEYGDILDDTGLIVAQGGPTWQRGANKLPVAGTLLVQQDLVQSMRDSGLLEDVLTYAMGQVLGFGTLWADSAAGLGLINDECSYLGVNANSQFKNLINDACDDIPLQPPISPSFSACSFWSENCMQDELMTPFLEGSGNNPLSAVTIAAMADLGYQVSFDSADTFSISNLGDCSACGRRRRVLGDNYFVVQERVRPKRRHLSQKSIDIAVAHGKNVLANRSKLVQKEQSPRMSNGDFSSVDQVISVCIKEPDEGDFFVGCMVVTA